MNFYEYRFKAYLQLNKMEEYYIAFNRGVLT